MPSGATGVPEGALTAPLPPPPPVPAAIENDALPGPPPIPSGDMNGAPAPAPPPIPPPEDTGMEMDVVSLRHQLYLYTACVVLPWYAVALSTDLEAATGLLCGKRTP